jgi:hypothetical protein
VSARKKKGPPGRPPKRAGAPARVGRCRGCGCTDRNPCLGGCSWVDKAHSFCSVCEEISNAEASRLDARNAIDNAIVNAEHSARELRLAIDYLMRVSNRLSLGVAGGIRVADKVVRPKQGTQGKP